MLYQWARSTEIETGHYILRRGSGQCEGEGCKLISSQGLEKINYTSFAIYSDNAYPRSYRSRAHLHDFILRFLHLSSSDATPSLALQLVLVLLHTPNEGTFHPNLMSILVEYDRDRYDGYLYQAQ